MYCSRLVGLRLGIPRAPFFDMLDGDVAKLVGDAIGVLAKITKGAKEDNSSADRKYRARRRDLLRIMQRIFRPRFRALRRSRPGGQ